MNTLTDRRHVAQATSWKTLISLYSLISSPKNNLSWFYELRLERQRQYRLHNNCVQCGLFVNNTYATHVSKIITDMEQG